MTPSLIPSAVATPELIGPGDPPSAIVQTITPPSSILHDNVVVAPPPSPNLRFDPHSAATSAFLSGLCYASNQRLLDRLAAREGYFVDTFKTKHQRAAVISSDSDIWVVFEGSDLGAWEDYAINLQHTRVPHPIGGLVHYGFIRRLNEQVLEQSTPHDYQHSPLIDAIHEHLLRQHRYHPQARIHFTGHSSGGVGAVLQAAHFAKKDMLLALKTVSDISTFGQPRVGNEVFYNAFHQFYGDDKYHRYVLENDYIASLPPTYYTAYQHGGVPHYLQTPVQNTAPAKEGNVGSLLSYVMSVHKLPWEMARYMQRHHGIDMYLDACLAPANIKSEDFVRAFLDDASLTNAETSITPVFHDLIDLLEHGRAELGDQEAASLFDRAIKEIRSLRQSHDHKHLHALGKCLRPLIPIAQHYAAEENNLKELELYMRRLEIETVGESPERQRLQQFVRQIQDTDQSRLSSRDVTSLEGYHKRLQQIIDRQAEGLATSTQGDKENIHFIMRHMAHILGRYDALNPGLVTLARDADAFWHRYSSKRESAMART